jgi:hypothetical protein
MVEICRTPRSKRCADERSGTHFHDRPLPRRIDRDLPPSILRPLTTRILQIMRFAIGPESPIEEAAIRRIQRGTSNIKLE